MLLALEPVGGAIELIQVGLESLALFWLFTSPGKAWFSARKTVPEPTGAANSSVGILKAIEAAKRRGA